jgi:glucose/mannose transport system substrate-binding protein
MLKIRILSDESPDVFMHFGNLAKDFISAGYFGDLTDEPFVNRLNTTCREAVTYNGRIYAYPMNYSGNGVFFNADVFKIAGVSVPKTYEEFLDVCETLKSKGFTPIALGGKDVWPLQHLVSNYAATFNSTVHPGFDYKRYNGDITFAQSMFPHIFDLIEELFLRGFLSDDVLGTTHAQSVLEVAEGRAAMLINGSWVVSSLLSIDPHLNLEHFLLPNHEGNSTAVAFVDKVLGFAPNNKNKDIAKELVSFYAMPEHNTLFLEQVQTLPCAADIYPSYLPSVGLSFAESLRNTEIHLYMIVPNSTEMAMINGVQNILSGERNKGYAIATEMDRTYERDKESIHNRITFPFLQS